MLWLNNLNFAIRHNSRIHFHQNYTGSWTTSGEHLTYIFLPKHQIYRRIFVSRRVVPVQSCRKRFEKNPRDNPPCLSYGHRILDNRCRGIVSDFRITVSRHLEISRSRSHEASTRPAVTVLSHQRNGAGLRMYVPICTINSTIHSIGYTWDLPTDCFPVSHATYRASQYERSILLKDGGISVTDSIGNCQGFSVNCL